MDIFDWESFRELADSEDQTREAVITRAFRQYIAGNSCYENMSSPELEGAFELFESGWIASELLRKGK